MPVKSFITLIAISLIALIIWWSELFEKKTETAAMEAKQHYVDAFMRDFTLTAMDEKGKPSYTLKASYFEHYNDSSDAMITDPVFRFLQADTQWVITAKMGLLNDKHSRVVLEDDVIMLQQNSTNPFELTTNRLIINTSELYAKSDQLVAIKQGQLQLNSEGMIYDNKSGQLELLARVSGVYAE